MLNKVPEVTLYFWVIKIMCTTVGETAADYLNDNLGFGLTWTTVVTGALLVVAARRAVPPHALRRRPCTGSRGVHQRLRHADHRQPDRQLQRPAGARAPPLFAFALAATFAVWYAVERTLSIHTIVTTRREGFYWLAILFTFALGTAAGDLVAEKLGLGFWRLGR